jgi:uncharacterized protein
MSEINEEIPMLQLRPNCECCNKDLPPDSPEAMICTFCADCMKNRLGGKCPNCGGEFVRRPVRPVAALARFPASTQRVYNPAGCTEIA